MATTPKKAVAPAPGPAKRPARPAAPGQLGKAAGRWAAAKPRIVLGLYQGKLLIAPDYFEPHEVPPGRKRKAA